MRLAQLTARDLMTREVEYTAPEVSLREAARQMAARGIHCLIVRPEGPGRAPGVLTMKDVIQVLCDADVPVLDELRVVDACTRPAIAVPADLCVLDCLRLMRMSGVRSAPVVDGGEVLGVFSFSDVMRLVAGNER